MHDEPQPETPSRGLEERLVLPASEESCAAIRTVLLQLCAGAGVDREEANEFAVAVSEAFTNAVLHGSGRGESSIEARLTLDVHTGVVHLRYSGEPFEAAAPTLPDESSTGGRGRFLMQCFADEVRYSFEEGLTHLVMTRSWKRIAEHSPRSV